MPNIELPSDFPSRLRSFRSARHFSESELAAKAGLTYKTIHALEAGKRQRVMERTVLTLAAALELTVGDLLGSEPSFLNGINGQDDAPGEAQTDTRRNVVSVRRVLAAATALLMVIALGFGGVFLYGRAHAEWTFDRHVLSSRDAVFGFKLWETHSNATWCVGEDSPWDSGHILVGTGSNTPDGGRLFCLERATGDTVWSVGPDVAAVTRAFGPEIVGAASFSCSRFAAADIDGDGNTELVVRFVHGLYYPCCICLIDRDGNLVSQYANKGHLTDFLVEDLDADGKAEVLTWGTNNAVDYQGFTVVLLDDEHWSGASIDSLCSPASVEADGAAIRLVVPAYPEPYMERMEQVRMHATQLRAFHDTEGNLRYNVRVGGRNPHFVDVTLNEQLRPLSARATDTFQANMAATWPDSLVDGTGPADEGWLGAWLGKGSRFETGQRVRNP